MCKDRPLKSLIHMGAIALVLVFATAVADPGPSDNRSPDSFGDTEQMSFWIVDPHTQESIKARTAIPDYSLWNAKRIQDYEDSLLINADPPIGVITIQDLDIQIPIYNGSEELNLDRGVGRIKGMAWLNETGNLGIAGHRDGIFRGLKDIEKGDEIEVLSIYGTQVYEVSSITIVDINDVSVLHPTPEKTLTLVTCYPFYHVGHAPKRYIVKAKAL
jgi:sortase A